MTRYVLIENRKTGCFLGEFTGETREQALDAMAVAYGYASYARMCEVLGSDASDLIIIDA